MELEFYTYDDEIWYRNEDGETRQLTEEDREVVREMYTIIQDQYTEAFQELERIYEKSSYDVRLYQYNIVRRFIKCNLGNIDTSKLDMEADLSLNIERVPCPLRGECKYEGIICNAKFNSHLTKQEERVARLLVSGEKKEHIADMLFISQHTVSNHIRNIYIKLDIHSVVELTKKIK